MSMTSDVSDKEETLGEFLASQARAASDTRLAGDVIAAVLTAIVIAFWRGPIWDVRIGIAICFLSFGVWGLADRDLERRSNPRRMFGFLNMTRLVAATVGFVAAAYVMLSLLGRAIGPVIS
jgi:hypothetical protein